VRQEYTVSIFRLILEAAGSSEIWQIPNKINSVTTKKAVVV
jgi:hypothetical protein